MNPKLESAISGSYLMGQIGSQSPRASQEGLNVLNVSISMPQPWASSLRTTFFTEHHAGKLREVAFLCVRFLSCCLWRSEALSEISLTAVRPVRVYSSPWPCALPAEPVTLPVLRVYSCLRLTVLVILPLTSWVRSLSLHNCCLLPKLWLFDYTCGHFHFRRPGDCFLPLWLYLSAEVTLRIFNNWPRADQSEQIPIMNNWCGLSRAIFCWLMQPVNQPLFCVK